MNDSTTSTPTSQRQDFFYTILLAAITLSLGLAAITHQSLWMDEGGGAFKALMPTLNEWWKMTLLSGGSDVQMPFYMLSLWIWHHAGAMSEFALRTVNLPWLVITVLAMKRVRFWPLVCLISPFVIYYVGELRPYAMQIAGGALAASAIAKVIANRELDDFGGLHATAGASLLLSCSSLTAVIWAAGLWAGVMIVRTDWFFKKGFWIRFLPWCLPLAAMGGYYVFTLQQGYRATGFEGIGVLNVFFGFYELIGLLGLGPSRNELRADPSIILSQLVLIIPALVCISAAWLIGLSSWLRTIPFRCAVAVACAVILPLALITLVGFLQDFRVLGRHLSPVIPAVLLPITAALSIRSATKLKAVVIASLALLFMLLSSANLRFSEKHARDDYRKATSIAIEALKKNQSVWWQADMHAARYYAYRTGGFPLVHQIQIMESNPPSGLMFADVIIVNRPDLRHGKSDYQKEFSRNFFKLDSKFTGFEIWKSR